MSLLIGCWSITLLDTKDGILIIAAIWGSHGSGCNRGVSSPHLQR